MQSECGEPQLHWKAFIMKRLTGTILLVCSLSVCARADGRTLALYLKHPERLNRESAQAMRSELNRLLAPAGIGVVWKDFADRKAGEDFDVVAVGSIEGSCAPGEANLIGGLGLADAAVSADGVLPYFKVDCTRLMRMLGNESSPSKAGRALARVIGHELYHILARTSEHPSAGLAKAAFSVNDLILPGLDFDAATLTLLQRPIRDLPARTAALFQLQRSSSPHRRPHAAD